MPEPTQISELQAHVQPGRKIEGIAAVLLPFGLHGEVDFDGLEALIKRIYAAGLYPAINMDTGYVNLLSKQQHQQVLEFAGQIAQGRHFIAGAFPEDPAPGGNLAAAYLTETELIRHCGGTPILFQCRSIKGMAESEIVSLYREIASGCDELLAFELGEMFAPFGQIYSLAVVQELMEIPQIVGIKHSSLRRSPEWERLKLRERVRPEFKIYTGNDLAIDMVTFGSDYLLGLATFAPDLFARRDQAWTKGDPAFYEINDVLQYLGRFAFRPPVNAYKHSAAQFLKLRGWIQNDAPHPNAASRPQSDLEVLEKILAELTDRWGE